MDKDYRKWHVIKKEINELDSAHLYFNEREIWWCHLGANVGMEQDGKGPTFVRPVLIFKKFTRRLCWVVPLSTKVLKGNYFFPLLSETNIIRTATLPQMKMIDVRRLRNKFDIISIQEHFHIKKALITFMR